MTDIVQMTCTVQYDLYYANDIYCGFINFAFFLHFGLYMDLFQLFPVIDGQWSEYGSWSNCSASCNGGSRNRTRVCNNPSPTNGGLDCVGDAEDFEDCNLHLCPGEKVQILTLIYVKMGKCRL